MGLSVVALLGTCLACSTTPKADTARTVVAVTGVSLDLQNLTFTLGDAGQTLKATLSPATATNTNVSWISSDDAVVSVLKGLVTPKGVGTATITVKTEDGSKTATCTVTVKASRVAVTSVSLDSSLLNLVPGGASVTLQATVSPGDATDKTLIWSSSDTSVATVVDGTVKPIGVGTAKITVTTVDGGQKASCDVVVAPPFVSVSSVTLSQTSLNLTAGVATASLSATVLPANASNPKLNWSTSDASVAMVLNGVITPTGAGRATISVISEDGGKAATCDVTVAPSPGPQLIAIGTLDGASDLSGLTGTLENGNAASMLGGMGSGLAWAGGNTFLAIPDRGPNAAVYDASVDNTVSFIERFHTLQMSLEPNTGAGLPYVVNPVLKDTTLLWTSDVLNYGSASSSALFDVKSLNAARSAQFFIGRSDAYGTGHSGNPLNARLDLEGIRVSNDGQSVFISDEYGPAIYQFDRATGQRIKSFTLPDAFSVDTLASVGADEISKNVRGRVANKGMEGLAITPDGTTLVGFMQSALIQDGGNKAKVNRIITIDIASGTTHQYAYNNVADGASYNSSEFLAINNHEFLVDERDGNGLGAGNAATIKRLYKIDLNGASDVSGLSGEANLLPLAVSKTLFLDIRSELNRNGITDANIPAKIEGLSFGPDVVINGISKHTLWVANDNDFLPGEAGPNVFYVFAVSDADLAGSALSLQSVAPLGASIAVDSVSLNPSSLNLTRGGSSATLTPVVLPQSATDKSLVWTSSQPGVASVVGGRVQPVAVGTAIIEVRSLQSGVTGSCTVTVSEPVIPVSSIALDASSLSLILGTNGNLKATVTPANATNPALNWFSSNENVATVSGGTVTPVSVGTALITAKTLDGSISSAPCHVTVAAQTITVTGVSLDSKTLSLTVGGSNGTLKASVAPGNASNQALSWSSSDVTIATVVNGVVTPVGEGSATITVKTEDGGFTDTCALTVLPAPLHAFYGFAATGELYTKADLAGTWSLANGNTVTFSNGATALGMVISRDGNTFYGITNQTSANNGNIYEKDGVAGTWSCVGTTTAPGTMKAVSFDGNNFYGFTSTGKYNTKAGVAGTWAASNLGGTSGLALVSAIFDGTNFMGFTSSGVLYSNAPATVATAGSWTQVNANAVPTTTPVTTLVSIVWDGTNFYGITSDGQLYARVGSGGTWSQASANTCAVPLVSVIYR